VALGVLRPADGCRPSNQLALDLTINPNTSPAATGTWKGTGHRDFARTRILRARRRRRSQRQGRRRRRRQSALESAIREAMSLGLSRAETTSLIHGILDRWYPEKS